MQWYFKAIVCLMFWAIFFATGVSVGMYKERLDHGAARKNAVMQTIDLWEEAGWDSAELRLFLYQHLGPNVKFTDKYWPRRNDYDKLKWCADFFETAERNYNAEEE